MVRPGYLLGRSHLVFSNAADPPSEVQHFTQSAATFPKSNCLRSSHEKHRSFAELKPLSRHMAVSIISSPLTDIQSTINTTWVTSRASQSMMCLL